ncbi:MAG: Ribosomal RNA small subunit methyltransferase B [Syntrophorhabdaceae bacterium PtaU1.Bin034]|nr:MAG: Ribosomal RNA small subunit methyltransferase B [Syntrophorhabdaceae bacterium PtaU1.Bin034]
MSSPVPARYKPLVYEIVSGVVRWRLYLDWVLSHFVKETMKRDVRHLLWMGLYQVCFMKKATYHVVNETVGYAKRERGQRVANFVNAVLRRAIRDKENLPLPPDPVSRLSVEHSFPLWLVKRWHARFGPEGTKQLLTALNRSPEFVVRVAGGKTETKEAALRLQEAGVRIRNSRFLDSALYVDKVGPVLDTDLFKKGLIRIQDETSQMAAIALAPSSGDLVLDACAGLGTKTEQIKQTFPGARIAAMDRDGKKLRSIRSTDCVVQADAMKTPFKRNRFDSILLDAPCSSLGIIRKHPEIKWRRSEKDVKEFGAQQLKMARALSENLKVGGHLVYSVCSFEPEETTEVIGQLKKECGFAAEKPLPALFDDEEFLSVPHVSGMDGFFIARLKKL